MQNFKSVWACAVEKMREDINQHAFDLWINSIEPIKYEDDCAVLYVESPFHRDVVLSKYRDVIRQALFDAVGFEMDLRIITAEDKEKSKRAPGLAPVEPSVDAPEPEPGFPEYTFENFIVADSNKHAYASCLAVANSPATAYNPLFIYGNTGLGKTHLLFAIKNRIQKNFPSYRTLYVKSEDFTNELVELTQQGKSMAAKTNSPRNMADFKKKYRNVDVLLVDDIQFIANKEQTQNEFFHTFDALFMAHKQIILVSDRPPKDIQLLDKRLCSRFESGLTTDISMPEYELKVSFIKQKAQFYNMNISNEVCDYIAQRVKNNIRQLEGVIKKLRAFQQISNMPPNITIAQAAIKDVTNENQPLPVIVDKVIMEVSSEYEVSAEEIKGKKRNASNVVFARQVAMYILKEITPMSLEEIGKQFSGRDHSTVHYALGRVESRVEGDNVLRAKIDEIIKRVRSY